MCGFGVPRSGGYPPALVRSDETVGDLLKANLSLGDIQNKLNGVVIVEIHGLTVHIQKDCGCHHPRRFVASTNAWFVTVECRRATALSLRVG